MSIDDDIAHLVLIGRESRHPVGERVESWGYEGGMAQAPAYTLTVGDYDDELRDALVLDRQEDDILDRGITCVIDDLRWELVSIRPSGATVDLIVEPHFVTRIRRRTRPRTFAPGSFTRASALRVLVREEDEVVFVCPARGEKAAAGREKAARAKARAQPKPSKTKPKKAKAGGESGIPDGARLTVKGAPATASQRKIGEDILSECDRLDAGPKASKAAILTGIVESQLTNVPPGPKSDRDSEGVYQIRQSTSQGRYNARDTGAAVREFLLRGFYGIYATGGTIPAGRGGAIKVARDKPRMTAGQVAQSCQGSGVPDAYDQWSREGDAWLKAFNGSSTGGDGTPRARGETARQTDAGNGFKRGETEGESTWDVGARFAEAIRWAWFATLDTELVFADERDLLTAKATATLRPRRGRVDVIDGARDAGHRVDTLTVMVRDLLPRQIPHGAPVIVDGTAGNDGRYLVETVRVGSADEAGTLELRRARDPKREQVTPAVHPEAAEAKRAGNPRTLPVNKATRVRLDSRYRGTQAVADGFVVPFMARRGLKPGSRKRTPAENAAVGGSAGSDHLTTNTNTYAVDFPTGSGEAAARALSREIGWTSWQPNSYERHTFSISGARFSFQILWGQAIDHADHVHVGIKRV